MELPSVYSTGNIHKDVILLLINSIGNMYIITDKFTISVFCQ
jgi:hypothetical protein